MSIPLQLLIRRLGTPARQADSGSDGTAGSHSTGGEF